MNEIKNPHKLGTLFGKTTNFRVYTMLFFHLKYVGRDRGFIIRKGTKNFLQQKELYINAKKVLIYITSILKFSSV